MTDRQLRGSSCSAPARLLPAFRDLPKAKERKHHAFRIFGRYIRDCEFWQWCAAQAFGAYIIHLFVLLIVENLLDPIWLGVVGKYLAVLTLATTGSFVITWLLRLPPQKIISKKRNYK